MVNITAKSKSELVCGMVSSQSKESCTINIRGGNISSSGSSLVSSKLIDSEGVYCIIL